MEKFLIIGGNSKLAECFSRIYEKQSTRLSRRECDITSEKLLSRAISRFRGKYVLNCAALTNLDDCEKYPLKCFYINTFGVYLLNKICLRFKKKLIHISSDYAVSPVNNYGWSKYLSEKIVDKSFLLVRTNFYSSETFIVKNLLKKRKTKIYKNMYFNPIAINNLSKAIYSSRKKRGILNIFTSKKISYLQFAYLFCDMFGINKKLIKPINYVYKGGIRRPANSYAKPNIKLDIKEDLISFRKYYENRQ